MLKLVKMEKWNFLRESVFYDWRYSPIKDEKEGWMVVKKIVGGLEKIGEVKSIRVLGLDHGDKEFSDIGEKHYASSEEMAKDINKILEDGNVAADISAVVGDEYATVNVQFVGDEVDINFVDDEKTAKLIATAIKKALE